MSKSFSPVRVKVLLDEISTQKDKEWVIQAEGGFLFSDREKNAKKFNYTKEELNVSVDEGTLYVNGKRFLKQQLFIKPSYNLLELNGNFYKGSFLFLVQDERLFLINVVSLEDYIFGVLRSESWPGWPLEVNKVFAVATRSYVIAKAMEAKRRGKSFHIKNTRQHQTYNGHHFMKRNSKVLWQAVQETKGVFLAHENQPILAMFDSCCGGIVPSKVEGFDFKKAPYLARDYACEHCKVCNLYRWDVSYDYQKWTELLQKQFPDLQKLRSMKVLLRDDAGLIKSIEIKDGTQTFQMTGKQLYSLLDEVKSFFFYIKKEGNQIVLKGRGYGHHIGLCQWGAREMVRQDCDYRKILEFYYPNTKFVRLIA